MTEETKQQWSEIEEKLQCLEGEWIFRGDTLAWLALMQHHGTPTRLLDCTYSPFIAAYFALHKLLMAPEKECAYIRGFKTSWFSQVHSHLPSDSERNCLDRVRNDHDGMAFDELFRRPVPIRFVFPVTPRAMNERLVVQQGTFLCPGDISVPFAANLEALDGSRDLENARCVPLSRSVLREGLDRLIRMNIDAATLFPGLQGYADSLKTRLSFLERIES